MTLPREPLGVGVGLRAPHYRQFIEQRPSAAWLEVHTENYLDQAGWDWHVLQQLRRDYPISLHGVGLGLGSARGFSEQHLERVRSLVARVEPALVSEHLAWSGADGHHFPDLLPFVRDHAALHRIAAHIGRTQDVLGRRIAVENPSHYLRIDGHDWDEIDFLRELVRRTGCTLLLDINNVHVSARNLGFDAAAWLDRFPGDAVVEIHLAGHSSDPALGPALLIDSHDAPVANSVWALFHRVVERIGPRPTLIERDGNVPSFAELMAECRQAHTVLQQAVAA